MTDIDRTASDAMAVAPEGDEANPAHDPRQEAGQDKSIARRLEKHPESKEAQLDNALDESMDASDPPSTTQPAHNEPAPPPGLRRRTPFVASHVAAHHVSWSLGERRATGC